MRIQVNAFLGKKFPIGAIVDILDDGKGVPKEKFWRNRLRDAKIDNCCEILLVETVKKQRLAAGIPPEEKKSTKKPAKEGIDNG